MTEMKIKCQVSSALHQTHMQFCRFEDHSFKRFLIHGLSYRISYSDDLQSILIEKHFSDIGFKASKIHLKIGRLLFWSVYEFENNVSLNCIV